MPGVFRLFRWYWLARAILGGGPRGILFFGAQWLVMRAINGFLQKRR